MTPRLFETRTVAFWTGLMATAALGATVDAMRADFYACWLWPFCWAAGWAHGALSPRAGHARRSGEG